MKHTTWFALTVLLAACSPAADQREAAQKLYKESMDIHDAVMPRMDEMFTLRQKLTLKLDSLKTDSLKNAVQIESIRKVIADLAAADKGMMDWMHNIQDVPGEKGAHDHHASENHNTAGTAIEDVLKIQQHQKEAVEKVKKAMEESIVAGKQLLTDL
jgi:hypothetical protein